MTRNIRISIHGLTEEQVRDTLKNHKPTKLDFVQWGDSDNYLVIDLKILNIEYTLFSEHSYVNDTDWVQVVIDCKRKSMLTHREVNL